MIDGCENTSAPESVRRQLRVIGILSAAEAAALTPIRARVLHTICYFADALAPVWGLRILDARLLKRRDGPVSPLVQADVDSLVGRGVLCVSNVRYEEDADKLWRLDADYSLNKDFAAPIIDVANSFGSFARELEYLREVVLSVSGFGTRDLLHVSASDANYGDAMVDEGGMVNMTSEAGASRTVRVATRFGQLVPSQEIGDAEKVHLYMRELYARLTAT